MKLLITGGAGFIGTNFIYYINRVHPTYNIVCLDALTYAGRLENLSKMNYERFKFVKGNICDSKVVEELFEKEKFDIVINFAAESHVDRSIENPQVFLQTNILGTQTLLDAALKYKVSRFHQISTDEVYGDLPINSLECFSEDSILKPSNPYAASKASADLLIMSYYRTFNLPATISRSSNNYGEYQFTEKFIPTIITEALKNKRIPVYGTGENIRDWLFVEDHCAAIDIIIHKGIEGEIYNVCANNEVSNITLVKLILSKLNKSEDLIEYVNDRLGHDKRYAMNCDKLKEKLGWRPITGFEEGLKKAIKWYEDIFDDNKN